jgi:hypothetical protein
MFKLEPVPFEENEKEQSIALLNNSLSGDDQAANKLVRDAIRRHEGLLGKERISIFAFQILIIIWSLTTLSAKGR